MNCFLFPRTGLDSSCTERGASSEKSGTYNNTTTLGDKTRFPNQNVVIIGWEVAFDCKDPDNPNDNVRNS